MDQLERMFAEQAARAAPPSLRRKSKYEEGDEDDDAEEEDISAADQILKDYAAGDFFSCLLLPKPDCDDAGKPLWEVTDSQIAKAFRKRSIKVHPDKNPSELAPLYAPEAKDAFDKLSDANRALRDPIRRGEALRKFAEEAFKEKCRLNPELMARMKKEQEKRDASDYGEEIVRQQREHRERVKAMREKAQLFRKRHRDDESDSSDSDSVAKGANDGKDGIAKGSKDKKANGDDAPDSKAAKTTTNTDDAAKTTTTSGSGLEAGRAATGGVRGGKGGRVGRGGARRRQKSESDSDDGGGLAKPVLGAKGKGGRKPKFIM